MYKSWDVCLTQAQPEGSNKVRRLFPPLVRSILRRVLFFAVRLMHFFKWTLWSVLMFPLHRMTVEVKCFLIVLWCLWNERIFVFVFPRAVLRFAFSFKSADVCLIAWLTNIVKSYDIGIDTSRNCVSRFDKVIPTLLPYCFKKQCGV